MEKVLAAYESGDLSGLEDRYHRSCLAQILRTSSAFREQRALADPNALALGTVRKQTTKYKGMKTTTPHASLKPKQHLLDHL